jgi:hemolysin III
MTTRFEKQNYSLGEEVANSITHGIGALLSVGGLVLLIVFSMRYGTYWHTLAGAIFGTTLIFSYTTSTLYHSIAVERFKHTLRRLDHAAIYLLIAGTYTPFMLISLRGPWGWSLLGVVWTIAVGGVAGKLLMPHKMAKFSTPLYLLMGWIAIIAARPLLASVEPGGLLLLLAGGLAYSGGVVFYALDRMPYNHMVWHLFVLAGSALHFCAILFYVMPGSAGL